MTEEAASEESVEVTAEDVARHPEPDVSDPAKLIRLGTMLQTVLAELQQATGETDQGGLERLADIHRETVEELSGILSEDLRDELMEFNDCCTTETPSAGELRVAHAQLVGWIQGLLRGMQATATAQAQMAQQQMMMMQAQAQSQAQQRALAAAQQGMAPHGQPRAAGPEGPESGYL